MDYAIQFISSDSATTHALKNFVVETLTNQGYKIEEPDQPNSNASLLQLGGKRRRFLATVANSLSGLGGGNFNITYLVVVEQISDTTVNFAVYGTVQHLYTSFNPAERFKELLVLIQEHFPETTFSPWFDATSIPPVYASSPVGFKKFAGGRRSWWWG